MISNHEEYSNDIGLENLKCSEQICLGFRRLSRKCNEGT